MKTGERKHRGDSSQEADSIRGVCRTHGGNGTAEVGDVRVAVSLGRQEKESMRCLLEILRAFDIYTNKRTNCSPGRGVMS